VVRARVGKSRLRAFADYAVVSESLAAKMPARLHFVQRGLADAGLAADDQRTAAPRPDLREQLVQNAALLPAAPQHHLAPLRQISPPS
jgi:hypothetical protein